MANFQTTDRITQPDNNETNIQNAWVFPVRLFVCLFGGGGYFFFLKTILAENVNVFFVVAVALKKDIYCIKRKTVCTKHLHTA